MHILARKIVGVFAHVERADQHGAGRLHALDQRGIARRRRQIAVDLRPGTGGKTFYIEQILHCERHAGKRPDVLAGGDRGVDRAGFGTCPVGSDVRERVQHGIVFGDPRQRGFGRIERGKLAVRYGLRDLLGRQPVGVDGHGAVRLCRHWPARFRPAAGIRRPAAPASATLRGSPARQAARLPRPAGPAPLRRR